MSYAVPPPFPGFCLGLLIRSLLVLFLCWGSESSQFPSTPSLTLTLTRNLVLFLCPHPGSLLLLSDKELQLDLSVGSLPGILYRF